MMRTEDPMYTFRSPCTFAFACGEPGRGDGMRGTITVVSQARTPFERRAGVHIVRSDRLVALSGPAVLHPRVRSPTRSRSPHPRALRRGRRASRARRRLWRRGAGPGARGAEGPRGRRRRGSSDGRCRSECHGRLPSDDVRRGEPRAPAAPGRLVRHGRRGHRVVPEPAAAIRGLSRVLRPGGRLVIGELGRWSAWAALRALVFGEVAR